MVGAIVTHIGRDENFILPGVLFTIALFVVIILIMIAIVILLSIKDAISHHIRMRKRDRKDRVISKLRDEWKQPLNKYRWK